MATQANPAYPLASLYVGDLDPSINEAQLYERFSTAGQVMSIRVCRDQITKQSLGYAYVNFHQPADAERALDTMNFDLLMGRPMRIMWSQRDPALRKSGVGNVFIKNLDRSIDNKALYDTFSTFGNILSCKIMNDEQGNSKGYGFVHFETNEAAEQAIKNVNNMLLNEKMVYVGMFMSKSQRSEVYSEATRKFTNVFVKNFGETVDDHKLKEMFEKYGEITSAVCAKSDDGRSKGFGFVNFKEAEAAERAVKALHDTEFNGKKLFVGRFQKKAERSNVLKKLYDERKQERNNRYMGINLYIKNLDDTIDDDKLRKEFASFGTITSAKVMTENGRSKGFGFVCFSAPEEATKAVTDMNGRIVGSKPLYVALAQRKDERKNHLASQYMQRLTTTRLQSQQLSQMFASPANAAAAAATGIYLPAALQNAATRFYPAAPSFAAPPVRPTPRWPGQNAAAAAAAAAARGAQVPVASTYQNYQMLNPSQPRARMPYAPAAAAAHQAAAAVAAAAQAGIRPSSGAANGAQVRMNFNAVNTGHMRGMPPSAQQQAGVMNGAGAVSVQQQQQQQQQQPVIQRGVQNPKYRGQQGGPAVVAAGQVMNNIQAINVPGQEPLTTGMLAAAQPQEQKQMLGERLYPLIHSMHPEWAGKITGMLLEIDNAELLHMLDSRESLKAKVEEAVVVLQAHQSKQQQQQQQQHQQQQANAQRQAE